MHLIIICRDDRTVIHKNSHPTLFGVDIILLNIPRHPKICHLTFLSFANKNISGRQVTMDYLKESFYKTKLDYRRVPIVATLVTFGISSLLGGSLLSGNSNCLQIEQARVFFPEISGSEIYGRSQTCLVNHAIDFLSMMRIELKQQRG